jgi:acyl-CoA thioesterase I
MISKFALYGALLLFCQLLLSCSEPQSTNTAQAPTSAAAAPEKSEKAESALHIVAFGDSLYAGYQLGPKEGLAPQLEAALQAKGYSASVRNAGVSGDTTSAGRGRLKFVLDNVGRDIDLVILGLGGNDMLRGIKPSETRANLEFMLDELNKRGIDVMLTGMLAAPNLGSDYAREFNPIFPELAKKYDADYYPFFLEGVVTDAALMLPDNIHPNAKGIDKVVGNLLPLVEKALDGKKLVD